MKCCLLGMTQPLLTQSHSSAAACTGPLRAIMDQGGACGVFLPTQLLDIDGYQGRAVIVFNSMSNAEPISHTASSKHLVTQKASI